MHFVSLREPRYTTDPGNTSKLYSQGTSWVKVKRGLFIMAMVLSNIILPIWVLLLELTIGFAGARRIP
jgi:hypothetical protein